MYEDLAYAIEKLLAEQEVVVVAISGHGGSGKSTLADKLARQFGVADNQIIRTDGLHAKSYMQAKDLFDHHDWATIMDIMSNARTSERLKYLKRNDKEIESIVDEPRPRVVIFEGIRLLRPGIMPFVDISVWIDCPIDLATARAKERNRQQGDSEAEIALWDTKWGPEGKLYVEQVSPHKIASFIYTEYI
ncbi:MAG TPA: AAA family ATPase [Verrucomicrobiae bacterium]|nr:AAA family ATPase [Verrucomicrobiae bacterium]